jgi:phospholipase C
MFTRRNFIQNMIALAGSNVVVGNLIGSIQRAVSIEPERDSSFLDAQHIVVLMQENRSFDHAFGAMRGVRGFHDPRAIQLENGNPVWIQTNKDGKSYIPFRLDIKHTRSTWMGCLPHSWTDQVDAANGGKHDRWLDAKAIKGQYAGLPLTMGYHNREDLPFYYTLADSFTVCDQAFCSTLTGTTPNRLHLWTGTARRAQDPAAQVIVRNEDCNYSNLADWKTFPERLEEHGISWKIYQNELSVSTGLEDEAESWLANFTDNPLEWFEQYDVFSHDAHRRFRGETAESRPMSNPLHDKAFCTNRNDAAYRQLEELTYEHNGTTKRMQIPKGDILYQFRADVANGELPRISWLIPPERFSDHPCSAWYGQWYLSEVMSILTANPDVWRQTIFILTYDENDGFFDHVPPFQAPHAGTGKASAGLDCSLDYLDAEHDKQFKPNAALRSNAIGLGFRVPMVVASPWSRGGAVCSQVFDHTSVIQLMETILSHQTGKQIRETNISPWRRAICGDLSSVFGAASNQPKRIVNDEPSHTYDKPMPFVHRDSYLSDIHRAQYNDVPTTAEALNENQIRQIVNQLRKKGLPIQEPGVRPACPIPYELSCEGSINVARTAFEFTIQAKKDRFRDRAAGAPFILYADTKDGMLVKHYAVQAGDRVDDSLELSLFDHKIYSVRIYGPNGFYRGWSGSQSDPVVSTSLIEKCPKERLQSCEVTVQLKNSSLDNSIYLRLVDNAYGSPEQEGTVAPGEASEFAINVAASNHWYDFTISIPSAPPFRRVYAGHVENGAWTTSDPQMA